MALILDSGLGRGLRILRIVLVVVAEAPLVIELLRRLGGRLAAIASRAFSIEAVRAMHFVASRWRASSQRQISRRRW